MNTMHVCWSDTERSEIDRTHRHASYSGHRTLCHLPVIASRPIDDSAFTDLTCPTCIERVRRDRARTAAEAFVVERHGDTDIEAYRPLLDTAITLVVSSSLLRREQHRSWSAIHTELAQSIEDDSATPSAKRLFIALIPCILNSLRTTEHVDHRARLSTLRTRLEEMATDVPRVRGRGSGSKPNHPLWWQLDATLTDTETATLTPTQAWQIAIALLSAKDHADLIWSRCPRRNMFVAAVTGENWAYGDPAPQLPAVTVTARFHPHRLIDDCAADLDAVHQWTVSPPLTTQVLRVFFSGRVPEGLDFLIGDTAAPAFLRHWAGPFHFTADYSIDGATG